VVYDSIADRWLVSQFSLPNYGDGSNPRPPSYACVAVSTTGDPTGPYARYDYSYNVALNDYTKWGVWTDSYMSTFNAFGGLGGGAEICAFDKAAMLAGRPAAIQCTNESSYSSILPAGVEGQIPPPNGEPALYATDDGASNLQIWTYKSAWPATTGTFSGPVTVAVTAFNIKCGGNDCVPQPSPGNLLQALDDRPMFRLAYRNFGDHEALLMNHAVAAGSTMGIRWWEIRAPGSATPEVYQQGTYAPTDSNWRWLGSMAQDQAGDFALGFAESSSTTDPLIAWTGRLATDPLNSMPQGEAVVHTGAGVEIGQTPPPRSQPYDRWGDYSAMTVDPTDDCTFWYTNEVYPYNGEYNWDTYVATFKFPRCAANDFHVDVSPGTQNLPPGSSVPYTVTVANTAGTPETVALYVQNLPAGVTGAFNPASVTAGSTSILTLTAAKGAADATATFMVIGTALSAVHPATADVVVGAGSADAGAESGADSGASDGGGMMGDSGGVTDSGGTMEAGGPDSGGAKDSGSGADSGGVTDSGAFDSGSAQDSGRLADSGGTFDSGNGNADTGTTPGDAAEEGDGSTGSGNSGNSAGCGCRTVDAPAGSSSAPLLAFAGAIAVVVRRRRRLACTS
jgi:MYXO-CTERM domain-containing protein